VVLTKKQLLERMDDLRQQVNLLKGTDKVMMTMFLERGSSFREIAKLAGVSETTVSRRIQKLIRRLVNNKFTICLRNRHRFTIDELDIAKAYFLLGIPMRKIAKQNDLTYYYVRETIKKIRLVLATIQQQDLTPEIDESEQYKIIQRFY
jgi:DNA-binding Lrp family transcriptional regulator